MSNLFSLLLGMSNSITSVLLFCFLDLSVYDEGVLKFPIVIMEPFNSSSKFYKFLHNIICHSVVN